ncbi:helix-turn-helix domain-containing protein [Clostridium butyricum]|uniref:helix-turn-helix domain-containing protein n=1 Tax=Clostridium butyricum TaxID=1492 RepID=UPI0005C1BBD4|nr:helix-turn-helix transcriptional regulator [Clostridium butyricum]KIU08856.1 transcriptional regulator, XRE family [Clostridium butyricum]MBA8965125.1 transcriptional regulator with XRE-family HTH domain [Clostridium butyricum]MBA8965186.1 transcriptional regulator with XRE-family HTH domain [Clostridium butyricum]MBA8970257.1 transcriptional regulator with XRE-family HTH domain [Clostridium butyricum]MBC2428185.1 helix-turn-helix transcriptional regulator [Clostridium butyricum]
MLLQDRLKELRTGKGLLQKDIAKLLSITASAYGYYEQGKRVPDSDTIKKLAEFYNVSLDYLIGNSDIKESADKIIEKETLNIPKEYKDKYKVTSRDKKQYLEEMKKANEAFFMNDELNEEAKKEMLDLMSELFWEAKSLNKRKK